MTGKRGLGFSFGRGTAGMPQLSAGDDPDRAAAFAVSINGYGAPQDPPTDGNLCRYLERVFTWLDLHERRVREVFLCGGYTNRHDLSEAEALRDWIAAHRPNWLARVQLVDTTASVSENIRAFAARMLPGPHAVLFCERSRLLTVFWLASAIFGSGHSVTVVGVRFDERSMGFIHRLTQLLIHAPIERLSLAWPWLDRWRSRLRLRRIGKARAAYDAQRKLVGGGL